MTPLFAARLSRPPDARGRRRVRRHTRSANLSARHGGGVQTQPSAERKHEELRRDVEEPELAAEGAIVLRVGKAVLVLDESGAIRLVGEGWRCARRGL